MGLRKAAPAGNRRTRSIVLLMLFAFFLYRIDLFWGLILRFLSIISAFIVGRIRPSTCPCALSATSSPCSAGSGGPEPEHPVVLALIILLIVGVIPVLAH